MGLSNALSGGIILFGITYVIFTFGGLTDKAASFSETSSQTSDLESKLLKTSIDVSIDSTYDIGTDDAIFSFNVTNTNLEKLWEFDKFDVIITYDSSGTTYTEILTYDSSCPQVTGEWCIQTWRSDILDPKILNNDETITIDVTVNNDLSAGNLIVVVSTQNGVVASVTTTV